jgi:hypothetical protein
LITDVCVANVEMTPDEIDNMNYVYALVAHSTIMNFSLIVSFLIIFYAAIMIMMLQRTEKLGELIIMVG